MPLYCITARHSPLPPQSKRLIVEAADEDAAVEMFLEENKLRAGTRKRIGPVLLAHIARWEAEGGVITVDVEYAAEGSVADLPPRAATPIKRTTPLTAGRVGKRPGVEPEVAEAPARRLTQDERDFERERNKLHGVPDPGDPVPAEVAAEAVAEKKQPTVPRKGKRPAPRADGVGGIQVLDDAPPGIIEE